MTITFANFTTISGHFVANCMFIFHKKEVQKVILRCLTGLNINWFKNYGLRCKLRPRACLANFQNIATDKMNIEYAKKWPEMVVKLAIVIVIRFYSDYISIL